ncbi:hypothetical protein FACS189483_09650 [Spirochaetia bacterium]|nr:hypothetical protein FACS189483_09650 [Spirochaetia bacterium]
MRTRKTIIIVSIGILLVLCGCRATILSGDSSKLPGGLIPAYTPPDGSRTPRIARAAEVDGHGLIAENAAYELYLEPDSLGIILRDKASGVYLRSSVADPRESDNTEWKKLYLSGVTLGYIKGTNLNETRADLVYTPHKMDLYYHDNGFTAHIHFPDAGITFDLSVRLTNYGIRAEIPQNSIVETIPECTVGSFYVYPFLGYSDTGSNPGYMVIPDGQGALITLQDNEGKFTRPYSTYFYGPNFGFDTSGQSTQGRSFFNNFNTISESEKALMPIFGMVHTQDKIGFLGVVEQGSENAFIEAWPNGASSTYDWITARFIYSHVFMQPTGKTSGALQSRTPRPNRCDIAVRYYFVSGEQANYTALAGKYRDFLTETGVFDKVTSMEYRTEVDFFGSAKKNWALFKLNVNMTSFAQAGRILEDLNEAGVNKLLSVYTAWQKGGATGGLPVGSYTPAGNLGGKSGMKQLIETAKDTGTEIYLQNDLFYLNAETHPFEALNAMSGVTGVTIQRMQPGRVFDMLNLLTPPRALSLAGRGAATFAKAGVQGVALTGTTKNLTAFKEDGAYYDRLNAALLYAGVAEAYSDQLPAVLDRPGAYQWKYAGALVNMPMGGSGYVYTAMEIPFLSIVCSGVMPVYAEYTNFQANQDEFFLKLIETGARPAFLITDADPSLLQETNSNTIYSARYDLYKEQIIAYNSFFKELLGKIGSAHITVHERSGNGVYVEYSNGLGICLNYGESIMSVNGQLVRPYSYVINEPVNGPIK